MEFSPNQIQKWKEWSHYNRNFPLILIVSISFLHWSAFLTWNLSHFNWHAIAFLHICKNVLARGNCTAKLNKFDFYLLLKCYASKFQMFPDKKRNLFRFVLNLLNALWSTFSELFLNWSYVRFWILIIYINHRIEQMILLFL